MRRKRKINSKSMRTIGHRIDVKFEQLYSSSSGNLYMVTARNGNRLMIECGVVWSKLLEALEYRLEKIEACFVSHEHQDHCKAAFNVTKAGIDVYASAGTVEAIRIADSRRVEVVEDETLIRLPSFDVLCFDVNHDAAEPLGFVVREVETKEFLLFATDTSHIEQRFKWPFSIVAIECSYDAEILTHRVDTGDVNEALAKRLLTSHMAKDNAMRYLDEFCDLSQCREIHLLHMSGDNLGGKEQTRAEFEARFFIETKIAERGCNVGN